jgi:hypothetical protein
MAGGDDGENGREQEEDRCAHREVEGPLDGERNVVRGRADEGEHGHAFKLTQGHLGRTSRQTRAATPRSSDGILRRSGSGSSFVL